MEPLSVVGNVGVAGKAIFCTMSMSHNKSASGLCISSEIRT